MKSLAEVKAQLDKRAALIGAARHRALPTCGRTEDYARPHIEVDARGYHLVAFERQVDLLMQSSPVWTARASEM